MMVLGPRGGWRVKLELSWGEGEVGTALDIRGVPMVWQPEGRRLWSSWAQNNRGQSFLVTKGSTFCLISLLARSERSRLLQIPGGKVL